MERSLSEQTHDACHVQASLLSHATLSADWQNSKVRREVVAEAALQRKCAKTLLAPPYGLALATHLRYSWR